MRSNVECRRCGCGSIIGLRESCTKCAAAQRARLHAEGVAGKERRGSGMYDNGSMVGRWFIQGFHDSPEQQRRHAVDAACKKLAGREPPKVHTRIEGSWVEPPQECKNSCGAQHWDDAVGCNKCGTTWARYARAPKLGRLVPPRPLPPTPVPVSTPAIGEVVSWEVAKADMQARPEARYKVDAKGCAGIVYGWQGDRLKFGPTLGYLATTALKHFDSPWTRVA